ncbi:MAG: hypothetical protein H0W66_02295 [Chthoniobacterales bacterium]|nr:hypothetical protein [Chthoniobacterales bacterium]
MLELYQDGALLASDDNWKDAQETEIEATGLAPADDKESAILSTLAPGSYTFILRGQNGGTGVGLVEAYDLEPAANSFLANISTRGFVQTDDNVLIAGFIIGNGSSDTVLVRAIGPSLAALGVSNPLSDPTVDLYDANGAVLRSDDNWRDTQESLIRSTGSGPGRRCRGGHRPLARAGKLHRGRARQGWRQRGRSGRSLQLALAGRDSPGIASQKAAAQLRCSESVQTAPVFWGPGTGCSECRSLDILPLSKSTA